MERNRYADLLRVLAIGGVVYGHWLLVSVTYRNGQLSGVDALDYVHWAQWLSWVFQVMPVFFLVGGHVNGVLAVAVARAAGAPVAEVAEAGWLVALQLWFLPVYMLLIALTPALLAAHRRWGLAVPAVMAAASGLVDIPVTGPHLHVIGGEERQTHSRDLPEHPAALPGPSASLSAQDAQPDHRPCLA